MAVILDLLGKPKLKYEGEWLEPVLNKPFCLLAYLGYTGTWFNREELAFIFWPDTDDASARRNLRQLINRAKQLNFSSDLNLETNRLRWPIETDVAAFRKAIATQNWADACQIYKGPLLQGLSFSDGSGFETWLELERESLANAWQNALLKLTSELEQARDYLKAVEQLQPLLSETFIQEDVIQQYLRLSYLAGLRDQALNAFEHFSQKLKQDLDLEPLPETRKLVEQIRSAESLSSQKASSDNLQVPLSILRPPRLIGREPELQQINQSPHSVLIIAGEAGAGKSRLAHHIAPQALALRAHEGLAQIPYYPLAYFIREHLHKGDNFPDLQQYQEDLARLVPETAPQLVPRAADPETGQERLLEALARFFEALATKENRFALLIDDLQWLDEASLNFFMYLLKRGSLGILATYRSYEIDESLRQKLQLLKAQQQLEHISLGPLDTEAMSQLLADLMQEAQGPPLFSQWLCQKSGGNPLFALELLKSLFESGILKQDQTGWHTPIDSLTQDYSELEVPELVAEVIQRRLRHLSQRGSRILQTAAVVGSKFNSQLLAKVSGLSELDVIDGLEEAEKSGLIMAEQFQHDLIRQSIYAFLSPSRRRLLHAQTAEFLGQSTDPALRAEHFYAAELYPQAVLSWREAAKQYQAKGLFQAALGFLDRAYSHASGLKEKQLLLIHKSNTLQQGGFNQEAHRLLDDILKTNLQAEERAQALNTKALVLLREGRIDEASDTVNTCIKLSQTIEDKNFHISFLMTQSILLHAQGHFTEATSLLENALLQIRQSASAEDLTTVLTSLAASYDMLSQHEKALPLHLEALELSKAHGFRYFQIDSATNLLYCLMDLGRAEEAIPIAEEALQLGLFENSPTLRTNLATAYFDLGRYQTAKEHYEQVLEETEHVQLRALAFARLAETYHQLDIDKVEETLELAYQTVLKASGPIFKARVLIATLHLGNRSQKERVNPWLSDLDRSALPAYLQEELEQATNV